MSSLIWVKRIRGAKTKLVSNPLRNKHPVTENRFSEFSALLLAQRKQLQQEVREKIAASGDEFGMVNQTKITDDDGLADATAEMEVAMVMRESQELQQVEAALARIGDGSYGNCCDCGDEIGQARLRANPVARRCLPCQEKYERAQGQVNRAGP